MTDDLKELETIRRLILTTEKILVSIERALPKGRNWLGWRVVGQRRRLEDARRQLHQLAEDLQVELFNQKRARRVVEKQVEPSQPPAR